MKEFLEVWSEVGWFKFNLLVAGFVFFWLTKVGLALSERYMKDRMFSFYTYWCKNWVSFFSSLILVFVACPLLIAEYHLRSWLAVFSLGATGGVVILTIIQIPLNLAKKRP